ncbi:MAG TPA: putative peptidoglycan glycosyltransferase FtsW [Solirubrobacteraceae bacterium]|nr:putative peptidoglycan glycosyltransferase FtsW [Solirubrobacteraceae bacterium]
MRLAIPGALRRDGAAAPVQAARERPGAYRMLITATLCLLAIGAVMVYSATSATSLLEGSGFGSSYLLKFVLYGGLGLALMHYLARGGLARAHSFTAPLLAISMGLVAAVHVPHIGVEVNGARRWIGPEQLQFEPSELLKIALVLYAATLIARRPNIVGDLHELWRPLLAVSGVALLLVASQPDIGTSLVICFTLGAIFVAAGMPTALLLKLALGVAAVGLFYVFVVASPYARARLTSFVDPWAHAHTTGFQAVQGQIAIGSGGLFGVGPGQSVQKIFYLPEAQTDFIVAVVAEEFGVVGVAVVLSLYGVIAVAGMSAARKAKSLYASLIAVGLTVLIVSQALLNVFAVVGLAPLTGVPLPLVSYGSSSMIVTLAAVGLLLDVARGGTGHIRAVPERRPRRAGGTAPRETAGLSGAREPYDRRDSGRRDGRSRRSGLGRRT